MSKSDDERLDELLLRWEQSRDEGLEIAAEELCHDAPSLLPLVEKRIAILRRFSQLVNDSQPSFQDETLPISRVNPRDETDFESDSLESDPDALPQIQGYEILEVIGRGGMGVVYKARQIELNRLVAIKMILNQENAAPEALVRFLQEAETIARLRHPNIIQIHDRGIHRGRPYFSLEFIEGGSLSQQIDGTPQDPRWSAELVGKLADAIQVIHEQGIIHRDLKPGNVLMERPLSASANEPLVPKITDFGLARQGESGLTVTGLILGTPSYMAPEQAEGREIGPACDIYALGAILYECLTGRPPFKGSNAIETVKQVLNRDPVRVRELAPNVSRDLETICLKCLEKVEAKRYPSARALAEDLQRYRDGLPIHARPANRIERTWRWAKRRPAEAALYATATLAGLLLLGLGFWFSAQIGAAQSELTQQETAFAAAKRQIETEKFFARMLKIRERTARPSPGWSWANLSDLADIAAMPDAEKFQVDLRSAAGEALASSDVRPAGNALPNIQVHSIQWNPNGQYYAIGERGSLTSLNCNIYLIDPRASQPLVRTLAVPGRAFWKTERGLVPEILSQLVFSPDGRWLFVGTRSGMLHRWDLSQKEPTLHSWRVVDREISRLAMAPDGTRLYVLFTGQLQVWSIEGQLLASRSFNNATNTTLSIHPIEGWLTVCQNDQLYRLDASTLQPLRRPQNDMHVSTAFFSPDARYWASEAARKVTVWNGAIEQPLFTLRAPETDTTQDDTISSMAFSNDGEWLATSTRQTGQLRLWELASSRLLVELMANGTGVLAFSPDSRYLVVGTDNGAAQFEIRPRTHHRFAVLTGEPVNQFAIHPAGQYIAAVTGPGSTFPPMIGEIGFWKLGNRPTPIEQSYSFYGYHASQTNPLTFSSDGEYLCFHSQAGHCLHRWRLRDGELVFRSQEAECTALVFGDDGSLWENNEDQVRRFDTINLQELGRFTNELSQLFTGKSSIYDVAKGKESIVAIGRDGVLRALPEKGANGKIHPIRTVALSQSVLTHVRPLSDGEAVIVGDDSGKLRIVRLIDGEVIGTIQAHEGLIESLATAPNGLVASGGRDQLLRLWQWDGQTLRERMNLRQRRPISDLAFGPDGVQLFGLLRGERGIQVWDLAQIRNTFDEIGLGRELESWSPAGVPERSSPITPPSPPIAPPTAPASGLWCETFADIHFHYRTAGQMTPTVEQHWGEGSPSGAPVDFFSVRWTGWLTPPQAGKYVFRFVADDGVRLWMDGRLLFDGWRHDSEDGTIEVELSAKPHQIKLEYIEGQGDAYIRWLWECPGVFKEQVVPKNVLTPYKPER